MLYIVKDLGRYIKDLRVEKVIPAHRLAEELKVSVATIERWEKQKYRQCRLEQIETILKVLEQRKD